MRNAVIVTAALALAGCAAKPPNTAVASGPAVLTKATWKTPPDKIRPKNIDTRHFARIDCRMWISTGYNFMGYSASAPSTCRWW